jgi:hypothetical protein
LWVDNLLPSSTKVMEKWCCTSTASVHSWCGQGQHHLLKFKFSLSLWYPTGAKPCSRHLISLQNIAWQRQLSNITDHSTSYILCHVTWTCDQLAPNPYSSVLLKPCIWNIIIK